MSAQITIPLYYDLDRRNWTRSAGNIEIQPALVIGQSMTVDFAVRFIKNGVQTELTTPIWNCGIKEINDQDGDYLLQTTTGTKTGTGTTTVYTFQLVIDSAELRTFLNGVTAATNFCAFEISDSTNDITTLPALTVTILQDYLITGSAPDNAAGVWVIEPGKTFTVNNTIALSGADGATYNLASFGSTTITRSSTATASFSAGDILTSNGSVVTRIVPGTGVATALATAVDTVGGPMLGKTSTDNAVVRFDGTTGKVQNSVVTIADTTGDIIAGTFNALRVTCGTGYTTSNVAIGEFSLAAATPGNGNVAVGSYALNLNTGVENVAVGKEALLDNTGGNNLTAVGSFALAFNASGNDSTAVGSGALSTNQTGSANVAIGRMAGYYETGSNSFYVNNQDRINVTGDRTKSLLYGTFAATVASQQLTVNAGTFTVTGAMVGTSSLTLGTASTTVGSIVLQNASNAFTTTIQSGVVGANKTWTWPTGYGSAGQALVDAAGDGVLGWASAGASGANPTASAGMTAVNGVAATFMRSDGAPAISAAIAPTWTAAHTFNQSIGATSTDGIVLQNTTAASAGAQKWSPRIHWTGQGWKTNATAASQSVDFIQELVPVQGAANPTANLVTSYSINGAAYTAGLTQRSSGEVSVPFYGGGLVFGTGTIAGTGVSLFSVSGTSLRIFANGEECGGFTNAGGRGIHTTSGGVLGWSSSATDTSLAQDTGLGRESAGIVTFDTTASGNKAGSWKATNGTLTGTLGVTGTHTPTGRILLPMGEASYFNTTGTLVTISGTSDGTTNMVVVAPTTALSGSEYQFNNGGANTGRLRYTGTVTKMFHVAITISGTPATQNDIFVFCLYKNGAAVATSKVMGSSGGTQFSSIHAMVELATNDYIELYMGNTSAARNFTVKSLNLFAMGV